MIDLPHVDEVLGERDRVRVASDGYSTICGSTLALLAIADAYHGTRYLTYLCYFRATLSYYATDQFVRHRHLVSLIVGRWLLSIRVVGAQLTTRQSC